MNNLNDLVGLLIYNVAIIDSSTIGIEAYSTISGTLSSPNVVYTLGQSNPNCGCLVVVKSIYGMDMYKKLARIISVVQYSDQLNIVHAEGTSLGPIKTFFRIETDKGDIVICFTWLKEEYCGDKENDIIVLKKVV